MGDERRSGQRYTVWIPVEVIEGIDRSLAVSRDLSEGGLLVVSATSYTPGTAVTVELKLPSEVGTAITRRGHIVRTEANSEDPDGIWRHRLAVAFDQPVPELEAVLKKLPQSDPQSDPQSK